MQKYLESLKYIYENGEDRPNRTGTPSRSIFGDVSMKFDLREGFPMVTTKFLPFKTIFSELLWFLEGSDDERRLARILDHEKPDTKIRTIWTDNMEAWKDNARWDGDCGNIYGKQWRTFRSYDNMKEPLIPNYFDQIHNIIEQIKKDPYSRRLLVTAWNPYDVFNNKACLPPCHVFFQFYISNGYLDLQLYVRSNDFFLGAPFNIASYALLLSMVAQVCNYKPRYLHYKTGDAHIYHDHFEQVLMQLSREPKVLPTLKLNTNVKNIFDFMMCDAELINYDHHPALKAKMAV